MFLALSRLFSDLWVSPLQEESPLKVMVNAPRSHRERGVCDPMRKATH